MDCIGWVQTTSDLKRFGNIETLTSHSEQDQNN